jgi:hypothetical protein
MYLDGALMKSHRLFRLSRSTPIAAGLFTLGLAAGCSSAAQDGAGTSADAALSAVAPHTVRNACDQTSGTGRFHAFCLAQVVTDLPTGYQPDFGASPDVTVTSARKTTDVSYGPADFQSAYSIPAGGEGVTVAIVDAQDNPNAESDLAFFRAKYGLPACTTANGCFKKVAYDGSKNYPTPDVGWGVEIALDLDAVSAACPKCNILLVEAEELNPPASVTTDPLALAVDTAVKLGAKFISNSYGITETTDPKEGIVQADAVSTATHYVHPGVAIFASSGDAGFAAWPNTTGNGKGANFPADIPQVFAVGGTRLVKSTATARGWLEGVWGSTTDSDGASNSGCSHFFPKPTYQKSTACIGREVTDLSADADPASGMNVFDTFSGTSTPVGGWMVVGGTSLASPLTAAIFAASGLEGVDPSFVYAHTSDFNDVATGVNGTCMEHTLCNGVTGYDGPSGNGTPDGSKLAGNEVDGGAPQDGGAADSGEPVDAGPVDSGPVDAGPVDAGPSVTWTTIYDEAFAAGTPGHCGNSGCHETTTAGFACGTTAASCLSGMITKGLLDPANPSASTLGSSSSSPLSWVNANGFMPADNQASEPQLGADIVAWVKAGAPGI